MDNKLVRNVFTGFLILLLSVRLVVPIFVVWADPTPTPTPTNTPTPTVNQTTVNNGALVNNGTTSNANTGNNTTTTNPTGTPTPTPTNTPTPTTSPNATIPTDTLTPTPTITYDPNATRSSEITASNSANVTDTVGSTSNTGTNTTTSNTSTDPSTSSGSLTPTPTPTPQVIVQTGDAVSIVAGDNTINTTSVNSDISTQTINVFGDETGNIDLSTLFQLVGNIITNDKNSAPVINVQVTGVNNYAYLTNTVVSTANTGGNITFSTGGNVVVSTGNADSIVSLVNKVNLTVVNSSLHLVTINIFGHLSGNIILPNIAPLQSTSCTSCGVSLNTQSQAVVNNNVTSDANTGTNTTTASGDATLITGNSESNVNVTNVVNQNILGTIFENLFINEFGYWKGNFLGWDRFGPQGSGNLLLSSKGPSGGNTPTEGIQNTNISNTAYVNNNISSFANTGGNITNGKYANVTTGNAYSAVSLLNFINSNFINSLGFFGFINIFGAWDGNIGGADKFITPTPIPGPDTTTTSNSAPVQENGGALSITNSNNVGAYVLPGDTVTFFLHPKDIGTGKVYGAKVDLYLIKDGQNVGGTSFNLGDIDAGKGFKITTGLVLSKNTPGGEYVARAVTTGTTGPNNTGVSATADSIFTVFGTTLDANTTQPTPPVAQTFHKGILGASTNHNIRSDEPLYVALLGVFLAYLLIRILKAREQFILLFTTKSSFKSKLNMLRLLLL